MAHQVGFLEGFRREMQQGDAAKIPDEQVAARLGEHLIADGPKFGSQIAEVKQWAFNVEIELKTGAWWNVECLSANAYHFYPAHIGKDGTVVWMNVWVADDLSLDETIAQITEQALAAGAEHES
jgi:hypothetical protein